MTIPQKARKAEHHKIVAGAADNVVCSENLCAALVHCPIENDGAAASFNFKGHRRAHDEAGRWKGSRRDRPCKAA